MGVACRTAYIPSTTKLRLKKTFHDLQLCNRTSSYIMFLMSRLYPMVASPFFVFSFTGFVVAKLPFVPFSLIQRLSHRGLAGDDPTDCAMVRVMELTLVFHDVDISGILEVDT